MRRTDGGMNPLNSSSPSVSVPQWFIFIPQIICNRCHAQRAHRRNNVIFLMDFQDECESDGTDTTEALLFFFPWMFYGYLNKSISCKCDHCLPWQNLQTAGGGRARRIQWSALVLLDYYSCKCLCGTSCAALACDTLTRNLAALQSVSFSKSNILHFSINSVLSFSQKCSSLNKMAVFLSRPQSNLEYTLSPHTQTLFFSLSCHLSLSCVLKCCGAKVVRAGARKDRVIKRLSFSHKQD